MPTDLAQAGHVLDPRQALSPFDSTVRTRSGELQVPTDRHQALGQSIHLGTYLRGQDRQRV